MIARTIQEIQGDGLWSPCAGERVTTRGIVTGRSRKGFFIQAPGAQAPGETPGPGIPSHGLFVFARKRPVETGRWVQVVGKVIDYLSHAHDRPCTQIELHDAHPLDDAPTPIEPHWLNVEMLTGEPARAAAYLNALEGMLVGIRAGATFVAPSNPFGDYVVVPPGWPGVWGAQGGLLVDPTCPGRWLPSFRILDYDDAPRVDAGARLTADVVGPLNYRANAFQIACPGELSLATAPPHDRQRTSLRPKQDSLRVLTLNTFNLDPHVERAGRVVDRERDIDDDVRDLRFSRLAEAIVVDARCPDIVALQEIQDDDGAEQGRTVTADHTLGVLAAAVRQLKGPDYRWADIPPQHGADGGQPGGNIRNAFLYDSARVALVDGSLQRLGEDHPAFADSRKPLAATFKLAANGTQLRVINVHLVSKRYQHGLFAPEQPGFDPREEQRIAQASLLADELRKLRDLNVDYYVTGDFNDFEFSPTLRVLTTDHSHNLVDTLAANDRYDYNHRGHCQALTHGIVAAAQYAEGRAHYEILHGNELKGVRPGRLGEKPSDHAYAIAQLSGRQ